MTVLGVLSRCRAGGWLWAHLPARLKDRLVFAAWKHRCRREARFHSDLEGGA